MSERGSQAIHRALRLLNCWSHDTPTLSLTDVAKRTGLTMPTAYRMMQALHKEKFLVHDKLSGQYSLGPAIMELAGVILQRADQDELIMVALPRLERLRAITGETIGLHLPMGDSRMCLAELVSQAPIRAATGVGKVYELPLGAAGKVLVAWSPARLEMTIARLEPPDSGDELRRLSLQVRKQGHAVSTGETITGASALAVPLFGANGDVRAAINVTGPSNRWNRKAMLAHAPAIKAEVAYIAEQLGYRSAQ